MAKFNTINSIVNRKKNEEIIIEISVLKISGYFLLIPLVRAIHEKRTNDENMI